MLTSLAVSDHHSFIYTGVDTQIFCNKKIKALRFSSMALLQHTRAFVVLRPVPRACWSQKRRCGRCRWRRYCSTDYRWTLTQLARCFDPTNTSMTGVTGTATVDGFIMRHTPETDEASKSVTMIDVRTACCCGGSGYQV